MGKYPVFHVSGNHQEAGFKLGKKQGKKFEENVNYYIKRLDQITGLNHSQLKKGAIKWFRTLPIEYQVELEGIALGANASLYTVATWLFSDLCVDGSCTSFVQKTPEGVWLGRNNDYFIPGIWGYITVMEIKDKIPIMLFGLVGGNFSGTGYNKEKIWLHYNWLPEKPRKGLPPFVFHRQALENCSDITQVEEMLKEQSRDGGMNLFVVDGKNREFAVFECSGDEYRKREPEKGLIVGANHYHFSEIAPEASTTSSDSRSREKAAFELLLQEEGKNQPEDYIKVLGNSAVEARGDNYGTVYSCVACPEEDVILYSANPYPAASRGDWEKIKINW